MTIEYILLGQGHSRAKRLATRDDSDLVQRVTLVEQHVDDRVAGLVPGGDFFVLVGHREAAAFAAPAYLVAGLLQLSHADGFFVRTGRQQRRLVEQVGQLGTGKTGCTPGDHAQIGRLGEFHLLGVNLENLLAATDVRQVDRELAVESARAQQCRIEHVRPVGRGDDDDAVLRVEAVHLNEQRVESLFALVVATAKAVAA